MLSQVSITSMLTRQRNLLMNRFCFVGDSGFIKSRFNKICDVIAETFNTA